MTWLPRSPFASSALEQAFWLASLAVTADASKRDRCVAAVMEMCETSRAKTRT